METVDEEPREDAEGELPELRLLVAADRDVEPRAADAEFVAPPRPKFEEADEPRLAAEPLLAPRAEFAPVEPKRALEGGATPARFPAL